MRPLAAGSITLVSRRGPLIMIGGGERTDEGAAILRRVVQRSGGTAARLCVCTAASEAPERAAAPYEEAFARLGASEVAILHLESRCDAGRRDLLRTLARATGVFFTGGDQLRLTSLFGGTPLDALLRRRFLAGGVCVAGTSAGASAVSTTMVVGGDAQESPKRNTVRMAPGLGLLPGVVVDQHFAQRGRIGRLLSALAHNPSALGLGLDEDTGVEVDEHGTFRVLGSQTATLLDARGVLFTNASESAPDQPLAIGGVRLFVLPAGYGFDPATRRPFAPGDREQVVPHIRSEKGKLRWRSGK
jgi:cyanophycinase